MKPPKSLIIKNYGLSSQKGQIYSLKKYRHVRIALKQFDCMVKSLS